MLASRVEQRKAEVQSWCIFGRGGRIFIVKDLEQSVEENKSTPIT